MINSMPRSSIIDPEMGVAIEFVHGCNYPWSTDGHTVFYGLDFGANVWGSHLGVSTRREAIARDFDEMARLGFWAGQRPASPQEAPSRPTPPA